MKVNSIPDGYDKVLQFNVYLKGDHNRDPNAVKYMITDPAKTGYREPGREKDDDRKYSPSRDERRSQAKESRTSKDELSPEDVGEVRSFLNRMKSESESNYPAPKREEQRRPPQEDYEDTMFKPRDKSRTPRKESYERPEERTQAKTPEGYREKYGKEGTDYKRPEAAEGYSRRRPQNEYEEEGNQSAPNDDGKYLEIYVRPKKGKEKLVYAQDGEPAEVVHKFTPKKNYDRYPAEEYTEPTYKKARDPEEEEYCRNRYPAPQLYMPAEHTHKKYRPKYEYEDPNIRIEDERYAPERDEEPARRPYKPQYEEEYRRPAQPEADDEEPESDRARRRPDSLTEDERKKYAERQKDLIRALNDEKNALRDLVDRLCDKLDDQEPPRDEYAYARPPREEYADVPPRRSSKERAPRPEWDGGPYRNAKKPEDVLSSPPKRKLPFDVDRAQGRTEWDIKEPYLKQYERISRTPPPKRYSEDAAPAPATYSAIKRAPRAGDEFCGLCDVYLDKEKFKRDMKRSNPVANRECDACNPPARSGSVDRKNSGEGSDAPVTYYVQGKILGKLDRPAYIRDLFKPNYLG